MSTTPLTGDSGTNIHFTVVDAASEERSPVYSINDWDPSKVCGKRAGGRGERTRGGLGLFLKLAVAKVEAPGQGAMEALGP